MNREVKRVAKLLDMEHQAEKYYNSIKGRKWHWVFALILAAASLIFGIVMAWPAKPTVLTSLPVFFMIMGVAWSVRAYAQYHECRLITFFREYIDMKVQDLTEGAQEQG
jgi:Flp pilus assembly protein TadB